ncbi:MAG: hypothetical protein ACK5DD_05175 [Cyclobacteriaceae bacterium]|jgi:hypothetical protein
MNLEHLFDQVDVQGRANLLSDYGELISSIDYYGQKVALYLLGDFYVELYYNPLSGRIVKVEKSSIDSLTKFLNDINVNL